MVLYMQNFFDNIERKNFPTKKNRKNEKCWFTIKMFVYKIKF